MVRMVRVVREKERGKNRKRKDRKTNSEQVLTCEHTVSGDGKGEERRGEKKRDFEVNCVNNGKRRM